MAPYQYAPITSPFVGSIADTMQRPAQALAAAEIAKGNAWAQAAQGIGQAASGAIQQATDPRRQLEQQQVVANQRAQQFTGTVNQIIAKLTTQNPDGTRTLDRGQLQQAFAAQNVPLPMQEQTFKALDDVDKSIQSFNTARTDHLADLAHGVLQAGATPGALQFGMALAKANGVVMDQQLDPLVQAVANGADIKQLLTQIRSTSEKYKDVSKPVILPRPGAQLVSPTGDTLATAPQVPEKPVNVPPGGTLVDPNSGKTIYSSPVKRSYEQKNVTLDGKPNQLVNFDPASGQNFLPGSDQPIDASRLRGNVPPSIVIKNENGKALSLPTWATDDSRPAGDQKNALDTTIRMTPNGLYQAALNYIANGQFPPTGRGTDPIAVAQRAAITSKVGAIASASGMDEPALRAFYKSNASSLTAEQKMYDAVQGFMATADKNSVLLQQTLKKLPDLGSPIFNQPLRAFAKNVSGDPNMSQFATYLQSVQNEYGRIIAQPNLAGQLTDSARKEAEQLVAGNATVPQIVASIQALTNEGTNRLVSVGDQIQRIQARMQGGAPRPGGTPPPAAAFKVGDVVMIGGKSIKITALHPDGTFDGDPVKK